MATASAIGDDTENCVLCTSKHNRSRPSFCLCKHCSIPLCLECMNQHHNDILQNVAELSHQYNELQELLQNKQKMIVDESTKTVDEVNEYFDNYVKELRTVQRQIIDDLQTTKEKAQGHLNEVNSDVQLVAGEIRALAKEKVAQTTKMADLSTKMKQLEQRLNDYRTVASEDHIRAIPTVSMKLDYPPVVAKLCHSAGSVDRNKSCQTAPLDPSTQTNTLAGPVQTSVQQNPDSVQQLQSKHVSFADDESDSDDDEINVTFHYLRASYNVDLIASDGESILYTSESEETSDIIAYCLVDDTHGYADQYRDWKQSRIVDILWWNSIDSFVCATDDAIYTVRYTTAGFKIKCTLRGNWSFTRIATNDQYLFLWICSRDNDFNGIEVHSTEFEHVRTIDFDKNQRGSFTAGSRSYCMTNNIVASICTRTQNNRQVFQVTFCDLDMQKINSVLLGKCGGTIEIRSDGDKRFFITTGRRKLHMVDFSGYKETIDLRDDGKYIAVLKNRRIAISNGNREIQIMNY